MKYTLDLKDTKHCSLTNQVLYRVVRPDGVKGGFIASEDNLHQTGECWVADGATVAGSAQVTGNARLTGNARMIDRSYLGGNALVTGSVKLTHEARVYESATVTGNATIEDSAKVRGQAKVSGKVTVSGQAEIEGDSVVAKAEDYMHLIAPGVLWALTMTPTRVVAGCLYKTYAEWDKAKVTEFSQWKVDPTYFTTCDALIRAMRAYMKAHNPAIVDPSDQVASQATTVPKP